MTKEEKQYCEKCSHHGDCGWVTRHMEKDCIELDTFSSGFEAAVEKACQWFKDKYDDIGIRWMRGYEPEDMLESFREEMFREDGV